MKYMKQFCVILLITFISEILNSVIPLPIPASIYGIVILFCLLEFKIIPLSSVEETSRFLVEIMPVMFVPAAVGLLESWQILKASWISYLVITVVSTIAVMAVAGRVTQWRIRKEHE